MPLGPENQYAILRGLTASSKVRGCDGVLSRIGTRTDLSGLQKGQIMKLKCEGCEVSNVFEEGLGKSIRDVGSSVGNEFCPKKNLI